jgi:hypothetical protein
MKQHADKTRLPALNIREGDMVMLNGKFIKTKRPNESLDHKNLGPFKVRRIINDYSYELELPSTMKIYPVFHPWLLHLQEAKPLEGQRQEPPGPVFTDNDGDGSEWWVDEIVDSRINRRKKDPATSSRGLLEYKALYPNDEKWNANPEWQPYFDFDCLALLADFHHKYPTKDGPHKSFKIPDDWTPGDDVAATLA